MSNSPPLSIKPPPQDAFREAREHARSVSFMDCRGCYAVAYVLDWAERAAKYIQRHYETHGDKPHHRDR